MIGQYETPTKRESSLDFLMEKPRGRHDPELADRLIQQGVIVNEKLQEMIKAKEDKELAACPFQPNLDNKSRRTFSEFWDSQQHLEKERQSRLELLREEANAVHSTFMPTVCGKSSYLVPSREDPESVFEHLYKKPSSIAETQVPTEGEYIPTVNKRSKDLRRSDSISDILYKDALRRQEKKPETAKQKPIKVSRNSQKWLVNKFVSDFEKHFNVLKNPRTEIICYSLFIILLHRLHLILNDVDSPKHKDERYLIVVAWDSFPKRNPIFVHRDVLLKFLHAVMKHDPEDLETHKQFYMFYENRKNAYLLGKGAHSDQYNYSFRPELSHKTISLAQNAREKRGDSLAFLASERYHFHEKRKKLQMEQEQMQLKEMSFKPLINSKDKFNAKFKHGSMAYHWKILSKKSDRAVQLHELALTMNNQPQFEGFEDFSECTFHPKTCRYRPFIKQETVKEELADRPVNSDLSDHPYSEESLTIIVTLPNGNVENLIIHSDEDKALVLDQFVVTHNLNGVIAKQLKDGVFSAIDN